MVFSHYWKYLQSFWKYQQSLILFDVQLSVVHKTEYSGLQTPDNKWTFIFKVQWFISYLFYFELQKAFLLSSLSFSLILPSNSFCIDLFQQTFPCCSMKILLIRKESKLVKNFLTILMTSINPAVPQSSKLILWTSNHLIMNNVNISCNRNDLLPGRHKLKSEIRVISQRPINYFAISENLQEWNLRRGWEINTQWLSWHSLTNAWQTCWGREAFPVKVIQTASNCPLKFFPVCTFFHSAHYWGIGLPGN